MTSCQLGPLKLLNREQKVSVFTKLRKRGNVLKTCYTKALPIS